MTSNDSGMKCGHGLKTPGVGLFVPYPFFFLEGIQVCVPELQFAIFFL